MASMNEAIQRRYWDIGIGYTLATGRLFCPLGEFQEYAHALLGRPVYTHEFGSEYIWDEMRVEFERQALAELSA